MPSYTLTTSSTSHHLISNPDKMTTLNRFFHKIPKPALRNRKMTLSKHHIHHGHKLKANQRLYLTSLPPEIILSITEFLPPDSCASLAFTCYGFLSLLTKSITSPDITFPHNISLDATADIPIHRHAFLCLLETKHWLYCPPCSKLHRPSAFSKIKRLALRGKRHCSVGPGAGIVNICPGLSMTYTDAIHLKDHLLDLSVPYFYARTHCSDYNLQHPWRTLTTQWDHGPALKLTATVYPILSEKLCLTIFVRYRFESLRRRDGDTYVSICPHRRIVFRVGHEDRGGSVVSGSVPGTLTCLRCWTDVLSREFDFETGVRVDTILVRRRFGNCAGKRPGMKWMEQRVIR